MRIQISIKDAKGFSTQRSRGTQSKRANSGISSLSVALLSGEERGNEGKNYNVITHVEQRIQFAGTKQVSQKSRPTK